MKDIEDASAYSRFDRVVDQKWRDTGTSTDVDRFLYGYDRASNSAYRENTVAESQATPVHLDELYGNDDLRRLTVANRGELVDAKDRITNLALAQTWNLDPTSNWKGFSNFDTATAANDLVQQRTANAANEITDISETVGDQWVTPAHDRNGNLTTLPQPAAPTSQYDCTYDAWNRLVKVETTAPATVAEYAYDGLNRRIRKYVPGSPDSYQHLYYNGDWQLLESREASTAPVPATAQYQYVWSLRYLDAPLLRDDIAAAPDVRLYYSGDANFNVTSLFDDTGTAVERYVYDPYGKLTIYNADWSATRSTSSFDNSRLFTGQRRDAETGLSNYRERYYDAGLGQFINRDPIGYGDGINLYAYVGNRPTVNIDPSGENVKKKYSRPDGKPDPRQTALIILKLVVDTDACDKTADKDTCTNDVKLKLEYKAIVTAPKNLKARKEHVEAGKHQVLIYQGKNNPMTLKGFTLTAEVDLKTIPCKGGKKGGLKDKIIVKLPKGPIGFNVQHEIIFFVEISCCGKIENERLDAINKAKGGGGGESLRQPFKDVDLEGPYKDPKC